MTDKTALQWISQIAGRYKRMIALLVLLQSAISGGAICYAIIMKNMVDCAVAKDRHGFFTGVVLFGTLVIVQLLLRILLRHFEESTRSGLENKLKERLFREILTKDYAQVTAIHSEEWMNRMTSDTVVCANGITDILPGLIGMTVKLCGALGMIFFLQPQLAYIIVPCGMLFLVITLIFRKYLKRFHKEVQERDGAVRVYVQERISSMLVLRTFGMEQRAIDGAGESLTEHKKARMRRNMISNLCNTGFAAAINGMYLLGIGYCGYGILMGTVSYGTLTAMMQLIGQLQAPLANMSGYVPRYYSMLASAERLMEIESYKEADINVSKTLKETKELYDKQMERITFDDVSFSYHQDKETRVFEHVNLFLEKGDYVAFTGVSGCGKSTLLKLLMGIYTPDVGRIQIMTNNQQRHPIIEWKRLFAYVPQGNYLMGGTIRDVITFGREQTQEGTVTVEQALKIACAEFVWELPNGVDTVLGEKGAGLSEGQMQRIAIARALYADTPILILDEATSALDEETEQRFLERMKQLTDKTVLIVTHRMAVLKICKKRVCFTADMEGTVEVRYEENTI